MKLLESFFFIFILHVLRGPKVTAGFSEKEGKKEISVVLEVPRWARVGQTVTMHCKYDVRGEPVYQVKWYKGKREFYRYVPKESPPVKTFLFPGVHLDLTKSNASVITLSKLDLATKGTYSCEVSTDFPNFYTSVKSSALDVVAFPESRPVIRMMKQTYLIGDMVEANCSSYRSKPSANLTWYINEEQVKPQFLVPPNGIRIKENPTETSQLNLRFQLRPEHFRHGRVTLQCAARIYDYYNNTSEVTILEADNPKLSSVVDNTSSSSGSSANIRVNSKNSGSALHGPLGSHPYFTRIKFVLIVLLMPQYLLRHLILIN